MNVMILIKTIKFNKYVYLILLLILPLISCDTIQELSGLKKQSFDDSMVIDTPDIMLPPNFEEIPVNSPNNSFKNDRINQMSIFDQQKGISNDQFVQPQVQNFVRPPTIIRSSKSPSDSIEKFRNMKKFTVGDWIYGQSVREFKGNNLYYRPPINKGYNFSRRYMPNSSPNQPYLSREQYFQNTNQDKDYSDLTTGSEGELLNIDQVPILE